MRITRIHIKDNKVINISIGDTDKPYAAPDDIVIVEIEPQNITPNHRIGALYDGENFTIPDTSEPLEEFVTKTITELDESVRDYVYSRYPQHRQTTFTKLQMDAIATSNAAAIAYIQSLWTWMALCFSAYYAAEDQIVAIGQGAGTNDEKKEAIKAVVSSMNNPPAKDGWVSWFDASVLRPDSSPSF